MKAEQRKELETNTLADKVGQAMQRVKGGSRRNVFLYIVGLAILSLAGWLSWRYYILNQKEDSLQWVMLDDGSAAHISELFGKDNNPGKAAKLQVAWLTYWEEGVRMIGVDPQGSMKKFKLASDIYKKVAEECKDDPIFEPQALLGIAVVEETKAVQDVTILSAAKERYKDVFEKYAESAEGKFAKKRYEVLNDKDKRREVERVYEDLQKGLHVQGPQGGFPGFGGGLPPLMPGQDEKK